MLQILLIVPELLALSAWLATSSCLASVTGASCQSALQTKGPASGSARDAEALYTA